MTTIREKNFVSAVVYVHNSEREVHSFLKELYRIFNDHFEKYEIICVNDASTDDSRKIIKDLAKDIEGSVVSIVDMSIFQGLEASMDAGIDLAIGDFIFEFDSVNMEYDPSLIMDVYYKIMEGNDIASAVPQKIVGRSSAFFYKIFNQYSTAKVKIRQETFRVVSRRTINRVKSLNKTLVYRKAVYANCGLKWDYVEYSNSKKKRNFDIKTKMNRFELAMESLILFTNVIQKFSLAVSMCFLALTVIIGGYTWASYLSIHKPVEGWTPIMLFLSLGFFGIFLVLTVTIQYLSVILKLIYKKKVYLVSSIEKVT